MRGKIDLERSINSEQLKFVEKSWMQWIDSVCYIVSAVMLVLTSVPLFFYVIWLIITGNSLGFAAVVFTLIFGILGLLTLYSLIFDNRLIRIPDVADKYNFGHLCQRFEEKIGVSLKHNEKLSRVYVRQNWWRWNKRIIVITDGNDLLVNISRFNERNMKSPFHLFFDEMKIRSLR